MALCGVDGEMDLLRTLEAYALACPQESVHLYMMAVRCKKEKLWKVPKAATYGLLEGASLSLLTIYKLKRYFKVSPQGFLVPKPSGEWHRNKSIRKRKLYKSERNK